MRWGPVVLTMAAIFYFSGQPYEGPGMDWWEIAARKLGHLAAYALLTVGWWWAVRGLVARPLVWAAGLSLLYACSDEYHQTFIEGRTGKVLDVAIDSLGIALACLWLRARTRRAALSRSSALPAAARQSAESRPRSQART
ncbi:MAG: VanZ family protein [Solirubrobacterales bacterium]